jgi:hypothetical protein
MGAFLCTLCCRATDTYSRQVNRSRRGNRSLRGDEGRRRRLDGLDEPVGLRQRRHGRQREVSDSGAAAADLLHGEQRGDGVAEDALLGGGERLALLEVPAGGGDGGGREDGLHHGLAVPDELGDEVGGEEWLLQDARDDGEAEHAAGALVELLEDLGEARVVDAAVVEQQHHLAVEVDNLALDARDLGVRRRRGLGLGRPLDPLLQLLQEQRSTLATCQPCPCRQNGIEVEKKQKNVD